MSESIRFEFADGRIDYIELSRLDRELGMWKLLDHDEEERARSMFFAEQCDAFSWHGVERVFRRERHWGRCEAIKNGVDFRRLDGYCPASWFHDTPAMTVFDVYHEVRS